MRDPEPTRSALIPANSRVLTHDKSPAGRATELDLASDSVSQSLYQSLPHSQDSNNSFSSFASSVLPRLQASSGNLSQNTDVTIPSSVASFERGDNQKEMPRVGQTPQVSSADWRPAPAGFPMTPHVETKVQDRPLGNGPSSDTSPASLSSPASGGGTKRTSSGTMKRPLSHGVPSSGHGGHSRTNSTQSGRGRAGSLAAELKTKLTYAMLKVNNGWQKSNLNQIEQLTSQKASPTSATFRENVSRLGYHSPRSVAPNVMRRVSGDSSDSDSYVGSPNIDNFTPVSDSRARFVGEASSPPQPNSWSSRSFPQNPYGKPAAAPGVIAAHSNLAAATSKPVLAPPVDIAPASRARRLETSSYRPPSLPGHQYNHKQSPGLHGPQTPNQNPRATLIRTPTEQARAEKEALDTLMFMSSPGNSAYYAHTSHSSRGQPSPMGTEVRRTVGFGGVQSVGTPAQSTSSSSAAVSPGGLARSFAHIRKPPREVARILDEIEDEDSDGEEGPAGPSIRA
ncbi:MAG: hypothetical protein Q9165_002500 [Trypethelium subeluteriae]